MSRIVAAYGGDRYILLKNGLKYKTQTVRRYRPEPHESESQFRWRIDHHARDLVRPADVERVEIFERLHDDGVVEIELTIHHPIPRLLTAARKPAESGGAEGRRGTRGSGSSSKRAA